MEFKYWRLCEMQKIEVPFVSEGLTYNSLLAIVQIFLPPCTMHIQRKSMTSAEKNQPWIHVSWKRGGNSKIPNKLFETIVQQGYWQNFERNTAICYEL